MDTNERSESSAKIPRQPFPNIFTSSVNSIAIYTVLCILRRMKREVGLEAMLEYLDKYLGAIETHNPQLKHAVAKALSLMSVEKMYREAMK
ncbi:MAG: hypothetical protein HY210_08840 [Candidatus Omnitrophica bacterium]|nr:hypothetical protein [Candidatus Omnitrophota bacterium]